MERGPPARSPLSPPTLDPRPPCPCDPATPCRCEGSASSDDDDIPPLQLPPREEGSDGWRRRAADEATHRPDDAPPRRTPSRDAEEGPGPPHRLLRQVVPPAEPPLASAPAPSSQPLLWQMQSSHAAGPVSPHAPPPPHAVVSISEDLTAPPPAHPGPPPHDEAWRRQAATWSSRQLEAEARARAAAGAGKTSESPPPPAQTGAPSHEPPLFHETPLVVGSASDITPSMLGSASFLSAASGLVVPGTARCDTRGAAGSFGATLGMAGGSAIPPAVTPPSPSLVSSPKREVVTAIAHRTPPLVPQRTPQHSPPMLPLSRPSSRHSSRHSSPRLLGMGSRSSPPRNVPRDVAASSSSPLRQADIHIGGVERKDAFGRLRRYFTMEEIELHNTPGDCWLIAHGKVYDVTAFLSRHPAGEFAILRHGGTDSTTDFDFHSGKAQRMWAPYLLGHVETRSSGRRDAADCVLS